MPTTEELDEELDRVCRRIHDELVPLVSKLQLGIYDHDRRIEVIENGLGAVREILVGATPAEMGGIRGDLSAFKTKATLILVLVVFTFGLKIADILGWTPKLQSFVK